MKKTFKGNNFTAVFSDENGYFSLTGEMDGGSGAIGDKLAKIEPRFDLISKMHLSNCETGEPMHSWANADYFLKDVNIDAFKKQLRHKTSEYMEAWTAIYDAQNLEKDVSGYNARVTQPTVDRFLAIKEEIKELWKADAKEVYALVESIPEDLTDIDETTTLDDYNEPDKARALAQHLDIHFSLVEESTFDDNHFDAEGCSYLVVTDEEADSLWDKSLDSYLDDCILPDLPDNMQNYFDTDAWKRDARMDGRGHSLNSWDGSEYDENVDGTTYFIYRQ